MIYGVDIASTRLDDVDKKVLAHAREYMARGVVPQVLDAGCGEGGLSAALLALGAAVTAIDIADFSHELAQRVASAGGVQGTYQFSQADVRAWVATTSASYDIVVLQRMLHYVPYGDALAVLTALRPRVTHLYLSVTGLGTAIARHYDAASIPVQERFATLDSEGQQLFSITAPLCLYSEAELRQLLSESGWQIDWLRVSDFGNIKINAV